MLSLGHVLSNEEKEPEEASHHFHMEITQSFEVELMVVLLKVPASLIRWQLRSQKTVTVKLNPMKTTTIIIIIIIIMKNFNRRSSHGHHRSKRRELAQHTHSRIH